MTALLNRVAERVAARVFDAAGMPTEAELAEMIRQGDAWWDAWWEARLAEDAAKTRSAA